MNIAIAGFGFMGATHARAILAQPGLRLAAVATLDPASLASAVQGNLASSTAPLDLSGVRIESDFNSLLADPALDAVDICLPSHLHAEAACAALRAGKHVLVEKPMAPSEAQLDAMLAAASSSGRTLMVAHVLRFFPAYQTLGRFIASSELGPLRSLSLRRRCAAPSWSSWFLDPALSGGAPLDLLIHDFDIALHLLGQPLSARASGVSKPSLGIDLLCAQLHYPSAAVTIDGGWHGPGSYPFSMAFTAVFESGVLEYSGDLTLYRGASAPEPVPLDGPDGYEAEIAYFARCCRTGQPPSLCTPADSARAVRLALRLSKARSSGETIPCPL